MMLFKVCALLGLVPCAFAVTLNVSTEKGNATSPILYGLLFEDVYHSGDGGLYAELIQNRAFQGTSVTNNTGPYQNLDYWQTQGSDTLALDSQHALTDALPWHVRVDVSSGASGPTGLWNEGYWGIGVTAAMRYNASFYLRGTYDGDMTAAFWSNTTGSKLGSATFAVHQKESDGWVHHAQILTADASAPDDKNTFHLTFDGASVAGASLRFQMISVFPETYKNSPNGLRVDLADALEEIGGRFLRFPGGNNLEGIAPPWRWKWNETIGPLIDRPGRPGTWGYVNTDGFGLLEMMQWCLDMRLEPILAVWGGLYLDGSITSESDLQAYIDDTLNELEFLLGPSTSTWGSLRAKLGYPAPFNINYIEISNEDFLNGGIPSYIGYRFRDFYDAIKQAYPHMKVISSIWAGYFNPALPDGVIQDLHDYLSVDEMVAKFSGYDHAPRTNPVLVGEYAAIYDATHQNPNQLDNPTLQSATSEAVYFLGLERNADVIVGICHGALIKSLHDEPDNVAMIKHSPGALVRSMSYYVAKLFASNYGSETAAVTADVDFGPLYWAATRDGDKYFVKIVNYGGGDDTQVTVVIPGASGSATLKTVTAAAADSVNSLGNMQTVCTEAEVKGSGGRYTFTLHGSYASAVLVV